MTRTPEEKPVVNENLTSEERADMGNPITERTPEEKAREYLKSRWKHIAPIAPEDTYYKEEIERYCRNDFLAGYHSRDEEVKAYREALKEIVKQVPRCNFNLSTSISYSEANRLDELIDKAKQLLE